MNCLQEYRKHHSLTQSQFAFILGITRSSYAMIENKLAQPTAKVILAIAIITKIDVKELYKFVNHID